MSNQLGIRTALVCRGTAMVAAATLAPVALLAFGAGSASAAHAHRAGAAKSSTIHVIEHAVTDTVVNSGGQGDKTGNLLTFVCHER